MRHRKAGRKLGRTRSHRRATLAALSVSLIRHKKIRTTVAKAKEMRSVVEKLITRARRAVAGDGEGKARDVHARRVAFSFLRDREAVKTLFNDIAPKVGTRPGGYTRVVKLGQRLGDGAQLALIELVDYSVGTTEKKAPTKPATKRAGTGKKKPARREKAATAESRAVEESPRSSMTTAEPEPDGTKGEEEKKG